MLRFACAALAAALLPGCSRSPVPSEPSALPSAQRPREDPHPFPGGAEGGPRRASTLNEDGCTTGFEPPAEADAQLADLAKRCATGLSALTPEAEHATLASGVVRSFDFHIRDVSRCLRVLASGGPGIQELELELLDDSGRSYGKDERSGSFALIGAHGVTCVSKPGIYRVALSASHGNGLVAVQVYQAD